MLSPLEIAFFRPGGDDYYTNAAVTREWIAAELAVCNCKENDGDDHFFLLIDGTV